LFFRYERQNIASADRRKCSGRCPDIIFVMIDRGKKYELIYTECSRLFCTEQKIKDNAVKIWRETKVACRNSTAQCRNVEIKTCRNAEMPK
jgi:hypothetical protein